MNIKIEDQDYVLDVESAKASGALYEAGKIKEFRSGDVFKLGGCVNHVMIFKLFTDVDRKYILSGLLGNFAEAYSNAPMTYLELLKMLNENNAGRVKIRVRNGKICVDNSNKNSEN